MAGFGETREEASGAELTHPPVAAATFKSPLGVPNPRQKGPESPGTLSENLGPVPVVRGWEWQGAAHSGPSFHCPGAKQAPCAYGPQGPTPRLAQPLLDSSSARGSWPLALPCCKEKAGELVFILALQLVFFSEPQFPPS